MAKNYTPNQNNRQAYDTLTEGAATLPPQAVELEEAVLGALMLEGDSITTVQEFLTADAFYLDTHRIIYRAIEELCSENKPVDLLTVTEKLKRQKKLKEVGGAPFLAQLTQKVASAMNIEFHATIIAQKYVQRELIRASTEIQRRSYDESTDVTDLIDYAEAEIFKVSEGHIKRDIQSASLVFDKAMKAIEEAHAQGGTMNGVPTGFTRLDQLTLGWQPSDLIIIAAYLISMVLIGVVVVKKVQSMDDYYLGGRSFGPLVLMATVCATIIGGSGLMGRAGVAYSSGFKAIMTALPYLLGMFIFSGFAGRISAVGTTFHVTSIPDLFEQRFGKTTKVILGGLIAFTMMGTVASQVTATATIINMLGNEIGISYEMGALIACVVFIVYTATSGLFGVIYTDVFQFVMLILFVYILIPSASLVKLGGLSAFLEGLAPELAKPYLDGGIVGDIITYFVFTLAGAEMWQRAFAAKSQKAAKEGLFLGTLAYGLTIPLVWFMGVVAHQLVSAEKLAQYGSTDAVVPALAIEILPVGLTGLALAGILSVIMSTADSYLIVSVQTCVHDIYKVFNPNISEKKELRLTRVFAVILPLGALVIALYIKNAYSILMFAWSFYAAAAGLPAFAALYWKKATKAGIIAGMVAGFTVCVGWKLAGVPFGLGPTVPGAIACAAALVGVSLSTYRKAPTPFLDPYQNTAGR